ncbi:hypothetical protein AB0K16_26940 [Nonomuraea jabiensis]
MAARSGRARATVRDVAAPPPSTGNSSADGARLRIWTCTGAADQKWTLP